MVERRAEVADFVRSRAVSKVAFRGVLGVDGWCRCWSCGDEDDCCLMSVVYNDDNDIVAACKLTLMSRDCEVCK